MVWDASFYKNVGLHLFQIVSCLAYMWHSWYMMSCIIKSTVSVERALWSSRLLSLLFLHAVIVWSCLRCVPWHCYFQSTRRERSTSHITYNGRRYELDNAVFGYLFLVVVFAVCFSVCRLVCLHGGTTLGSRFAFQGGLENRSSGGLWRSHPVAPSSRCCSVSASH